MPLPQLFPHLNKRLHLARSWKTVVNEAAILICLLVEVPHGWQAEVSQIVAEFLKVFLAQHLCLSFVRASSHAGGFYTFRFAFATLREYPL